VPDDIALVGFDDVPVARYVNPPLTTIRLPAHQLGAEAARLVLRLIAGEDPEETDILLQTTLVVRDSCGSGALRHSVDRKGGDVSISSDPYAVSST